MLSQKLALAGACIGSTFCPTCLFIVQLKCHYYQTSQKNLEPCGQSHKIRFPSNPHKSGIGETGFSSLWDCPRFPANPKLTTLGNRILSVIRGKSVMGKSYLLRIQFPTKRLWEYAVPISDLWGFAGKRILWDWPLVSVPLCCYTSTLHTFLALSTCTMGAIFVHSPPSGHFTKPGKRLYGGQCIRE